MRHVLDVFNQLYINAKKSLNLDDVVALHLKISYLLT